MSEFSGKVALITGTTGIAQATAKRLAESGAAIVMDGRLWHTSGRNVTRDSDRALLFAYYSRAFIRPQANWHEVLRREVISGLSERQRQLFGFGPLANAYGAALVRL